MSAPGSSFTSQSPKLSSFHETIVTAFKEGDPNVETKSAERDLVAVVLQIYDSLGKGGVDAMLQCFNEETGLLV